MSFGGKEDPRPLLNEAIGTRLVRAWQWTFFYEADVSEPDMGRVELEFSDGELLYLYDSGGGSHLNANREGWNLWEGSDNGGIAELRRKFGIWRKIDISYGTDVRPYLGNTVVSYDIILGRYDTIVGIEFIIGDSPVAIFTFGDEIRSVWGDARDELCTRGYSYIVGNSI
jgi:hypothetical protein